MADFSSLDTRSCSCARFAGRFMTIACAGPRPNVNTDVLTLGREPAREAGGPLHGVGLRRRSGAVRARHPQGPRAWRGARPARGVGRLASSGTGRSERVGSREPRRQPARGVPGGLRGAASPLESWPTGGWARRLGCAGARLQQEIFCLRRRTHQASVTRPPARSASVPGSGTLPMANSNAGFEVESLNVRVVNGFRLLTSTA